MSEEEKILEFIKQEYGNYDNYVRDLLDLYNKEKEKNEQLLNEQAEVKISVSADNIIRNLKNELDKEKEKNLYKDNIIKNLGLKTIPKTITEFEKLMETNYISKDKIKEMKQCIDKEHDKAIIEFMRKKENFTADGDVAQTLNWISGQLEELLEERN